MKKISLFLAFIFLVGTTYQVKAQKDQRTTSTRIADVLAQLPAIKDAALQTAMKEMEGLGEAGLMQLAGQLVPPGKGDNSKLEYAMMGYTSYVSGKGKETLKQVAESAWCKSLTTLKDKNNVSFLMSMLEIIGTDQSVSFLQPFLNEEVLNRKAAATLATIGTENAGLALTKALTTSTGSKNALLDALGNMRFAAGLKEISGFINSTDKGEKDGALFALAEIADPSSAKTLLDDTGSSGEPFGNRYATARYASYINRLNVTGHSAPAQELAASFFKKAAKSNVFARTAALKLMVALQQDKAMKQLVNAAVDKDVEYRNAALQMAKPYLNDENAQLYIKKLKKASPEVQADIIHFLGMHKSEVALKTISKYAHSSGNSGVKNAALIALAQIGGPQVASNLLGILKNSNAEEAAVITQGLLLLKEPGLTDMVIADLPNLSGAPKAALINVLAAQQSGKGFSAIATELTSSEPIVKKAAFQALPNVAAPEALPQLFTLLESGLNAEETAVIQNAIIAALKEVKTDKEKEILVMNKMKESTPDKHYLYFPALSSIGSPQALGFIFEAYKNNKGEARLKAFNALTSWTNTNAMEALYSIASGQDEPKQKEAALLSYIRLIKKAEVPQEQKLLLLKKAMGVAQNAAQKNMILSETANITTFPALAFAAGYLNDNGLKEKAAAAVMNIGLSSKAFHGSLVRSWLTKAMNSLGGADAVYAQKSIQKFLDDMPQKEGYVELFNGKDLTGWKGLVENPIARSKMSKSKLDAAQKKADEVMKNGWIVENGQLVFTGKGDNIATLKNYGDMEMQLDWKIYDEGHKEGDAGVYLRGTPQVQMWDTSRVAVGAQVGSGGLYNNEQNESKPSKVADNKLGEWNHFYIKMVGDKVTVYLNGELVADNVPLENYWDRKMPLFPEEQIELQAHGSRVAYRDIYIKEIPRVEHFTLSDQEKKEGYKVLFDGTNMDEWTGNTTDYIIEDGVMVIRPQPGSRGNLYSKDEYSDFIFRFEFKLTPGANNGLGIRAPEGGDAAYKGMELQILDNEAEVYKNLEKYQYHGSVYGVIPAKRGFLKPVGEWNYQEVVVKGPKVKVTLNGTVILDGDLTEARKNGTMDHKEHPGISNEKGHFGFLGHGSVVYFKNIRVKEL